MTYSPGIFSYKTECEICGAKLNDHSRSGLCKLCSRPFLSKEYSSLVKTILRKGSIKANT